jgi:hypothetical protein
MKTRPPFSSETCQWLKCPLNGLRAQSMVRPVVGLLPLAFEQVWFWMAFPQFLMKQLYRCDSIIIASFVGKVYTTRRWRWLLLRRGYGIKRHYPFYLDKEKYTQKGKRNQERHWRSFWMCATGTGQQVVQLLDSYMFVIVFQHEKLEIYFTKSHIFKTVFFSLNFVRRVLVRI